MKDVKLKKVSEKSATFNILNETKQVTGILICNFLPDSIDWFSTIPKNKLENWSELKNQAILELRKASQNTQNSAETALPV